MIERIKTALEILLENPEKFRTRVRAWTLNNNNLYNIGYYYNNMRFNIDVENNSINFSIDQNDGLLYSEISKYFDDEIIHQEIILLCQKLYKQCKQLTMYTLDTFIFQNETNVNDGFDN